MLSPDLVKLIARTDRSGECWIWRGALLASGYGQMKSCGKNRRVHRVAYELAYGPVPDGLVIDHLCRVKACCRPDHLEAVTQRENLLRGNTVNAANAAKVTCVNGHALSGANVYVNPTTGHRSCRSCHRRSHWRAA